MAINYLYHSLDKNLKCSDPVWGWLPGAGGWHGQVGHWSLLGWTGSIIINFFDRRNRSNESYKWLHYFEFICCVQNDSWTHYDGHPVVKVNLQFTDILILKNTAERKNWERLACQNSSVNNTAELKFWFLRKKVIIKLTVCLNTRCN